MDNLQHQKDLKTIVSKINKHGMFGGRLRIENLPVSICNELKAVDIDNDYQIIIVTDESSQINEVLAGRNRENTLYLYATGSTRYGAMTKITTTTTLIKLPNTITKRLSTLQQ
jgi:hypothetical protein